MKRSIKRTLGTIKLIYEIGKRAIIGEPFLLMLILPQRERVYTELKDISVPIADSAFHAALEYLKQNELISVNLTEEEQVFVDEKDI